MNQPSYILNLHYGATLKLAFFDIKLRYSLRNTCLVTEPVLVSTCCALIRPKHLSVVDRRISKHKSGPSPRLCMCLGKMIAQRRGMTLASGGNEPHPNLDENCPRVITAVFAGSIA